MEIYQKKTNGRVRGTLKDKKKNYKKKKYNFNSCKNIDKSPDIL